jgi:hypothetical protein
MYNFIAYDFIILTPRQLIADYARHQRDIAKDNLLEIVKALEAQEEHRVANNALAATSTLDLKNRQKGG